MLKNLIVLSDGTEISTGENAIIKTNYSSYANSGTELTPGSVCAAMLEMKFFAPSGRISLEHGEEVRYYKVSDNGNRTLVGLFVLEKPTKPSANTYQFTAYDRISKLDRNLGLWLKNLDGWPYTMSEFAQIVCAQCGVTLIDNPDLPNGDLQIQQFYDSEITGRKIMEWIGQLAGRFCRATPEGEIEFAWYEDSGLHLLPDKDPYYFGGSLSFEDYQVAEIFTVRIKISDDDVGVTYPENASADSNTYVVSGNFLLGGIAEEKLREVAQNLLQQISGATYTPCKVSCPVDYGIRAGDIFSVTDRNGKTIQGYAMSVTNKGQKITVSCTGSARRDSSTAVNNESMKAMNGKIMEIKKTVDGINVDVRQLQVSMEKTQEDITKLEISASGWSSDVSKIIQETGKYDLGYLPNGWEITVYGHGFPDSEKYPPGDFPDQYYLDQDTGDVYQSDGSGWSKALYNEKEVTLPLAEEILASKIEQTAEEITGKVENNAGEIASLALTVGSFNTRIENAEGAASEALQTAQGFDQRVTDAEGNASEAKQTADAVSQTVSGFDGRITKVEQTAGKVSVEVKDEYGDVLLSTFIDSDTWQALRTENGEITSGFYFDFALGRFMYKGAGEFYSADGTTFVRIEGNRLVLYSSKDTEEPTEKLSIGFITGRDPDNTYDVDYPFIELGASDNQGQVGLVKKFWDGMWVGNSYPKNESGTFAPKQNYGGFFINTLNGKSYVVFGENMQNVYTGEAIAKFR